MDFAQAQALAKENKISFYETSAKTAAGLDDCMTDIFEQAYAYKFKKNENPEASAQDAAKAAPGDMDRNESVTLDKQRKSMR